MKGSITRETLIKMAVRIALVIVGSTGISYLHIMSTLESQTQRQLEKYITERGQRESSIFLLTKDNHALLEQDLRRRLDEVGDGRQIDFERLLVRSPDGVIRNQPNGFDRSRQPSVFIDKNLTITPEIRDRVLTFYDLVMTYGPSWRSRFQNTYINAPENFMVMYWPEVPWAENATADQNIPKEEYFWIADKKHNPARETVCTGLYYDQVARDWTVSCETPIDIGGKQIATIGHDIVLNELLDRTLKDRLQGTYNMIFREDGRLIAHPEKGDEIKEKLGNFNILTSGDPHLVRIFQLVKDLKPGQVVVENSQDNEYLAIAKLDLPNWYFVTVFPKSILAGLAFENARFILILGLIALVIEVTILFFVLRQQVAAPLNNLMMATDQITAGDFNIQLDTTRLDELGRLAHSFNAMAGEVYAREARLKQAQEALEATDKLKDEFLANTSHELRTPLNGIIGIAESLIDGVTGKLPATTISNLAMIASSGRRLATLVNDILDFSKLRHQTIELQLKPVAVREIVEVVLTLNRLLISQKHLQLVNDIPADLPLVSADENRLQQILYNLIGNAIKFTDSGSVQVSARLISSEEDGQESKIAITISDTGIGIPEDKLDRVFESFEQADGSTARIYGGTGLGLAISKKLVELHGGEIGVESMIDQGSRFTFTLPVSQISAVSSQSVLVSSHRYQSSPVLDSLPSEVDAHAHNNRQTAKNHPEWSILIVDDEPVNRQVLVNHLSLYNYEITEAASGIEALAILEGGLKPDLILLDVMMPRMTGYEVTHKIRQTWQASELPIVLLTARNHVSDLVVGFEAGANDYLTKPISKDELLARIKVHCSQAAIFLENSRLYQDLQASEARVCDRALLLEQSLQLLQQTQLQLVQNEKMASIGQLVAGVAHEINNPLGFITGNLSHAEAFIQDLIGLLELYQQQYPQPAPEIVAQIKAVDLPYLMEDLPQLITSLKTGTDRICEISTSLRIFSRADTTSKVAFNLHEGINSTLMILKHRLKANNRRPKIEVSKDYGDLPLVNCYPGQLNQVFLNLLGNAIDAIDESVQGQSYQVIQANPKEIIIRTETSQDQQWARIYIKDNGLGMTEAVKQKIFDHLFTTKPVGQGTGLGLSISYQIVVEKHGGKLLCISSPGEGAEFVIQIPI
ncbi:ATP-binding protein [Cylindrospermum sp. FACHB-282]|uniref:ATP-binding protein n=1 Tax=Cylindrospermum sp. FACHB-282 TaxID=2692794 RepID=UPI0018F0007C|nr:ATP-binding protein [Cylindrospermum sp. FACHB-282]